MCLYIDTLSYSLCNIAEALIRILCVCHDSISYFIFNSIKLLKLHIFGKNLISRYLHVGYAYSDQCFNCY